MVPIRDLRFDVEMRAFTPEERSQYRQVLYDACHLDPIYKDEDLMHAVGKMNELAENGQVVIVFNTATKKVIGTVTFDVIYTWWTTSLVLVEEQIMCWDKNIAGFGRVAMTVLDTLGYDYGCKFIVTGNSLRNPVVDNIYHKAGFKPFMSYVKELK